MELSQGWEGYLITHEPYFCVLDGALMVLSVVVFNVVHPAWYLHGPVKDEIPIERMSEEK